MACSILERISGLEPASHRGITLKGKNLLTCPSRESAPLAEEICTPMCEGVKLYVTFHQHKGHTETWT